MDRVSSTNYQTVGGIRVWQNKNLGAGILGTAFDQVWFTGVQESIVDVLLHVGLTPTDFPLAPDAQLTQAVARMAAANSGAAITANTTLTSDNAGLVLVNAAGGNVTLTLPASGAANGVPLRYTIARLDGTTNTVTLSPHAGDTLSLGNGAVGPMSVVSLHGDGGTQWVQTGASHGVQTFTGSASFTVPAPLIEVEVWGGGAGSWASVSGMPGGGSGGGGYSRKLIAGLTTGASIAVTIGAGGAAGTTAPLAPTSGGTTSFGSYCSATGGAPNGLNTTSVPTFGGSGGAGTGGDLNLAGGDGGNAVGNYGGFGGGPPFGPGTHGVANGAGSAGDSPGCGASGAGTGPGGTSAQNGAAGAAGICIVRW